MASACVPGQIPQPSCWFHKLLNILPVNSSSTVGLFPGTVEGVHQHEKEVKVPGSETSSQKKPLPWAPGFREPCITQAHTHQVYQRPCGHLCHLGFHAQHVWHDHNQLLSAPHKGFPRLCVLKTKSKHNWPPWRFLGGVHRRHTKTASECRKLLSSTALNREKKPN